MARFILALFGAATLLGSTAHASEENSDAVFGLAQGCYAVQSLHNDRFMRRYKTNGTINNGWSFDFRAENAGQAASFYFKPSGFGTFLMRDQAGRFLDTRLPAEITAGTDPAQHANWRIDQRVEGGEHQFKLTSLYLNRSLRHNWNSRGIYFIDLLNPWNRNSEDWFRLVPAENCADFPEAELNIAGDRDQLKGNANAPVRGSIDAHTHITSYEFMGGTMMGGAPFHPFGVTKALADSSDVHGPNGSLDVIGNLMGFNDINFRYNTAGWPDFPFWPNHQSLSHTGYYYRWIERAFLGGQRMMVTHLVENEVLCNIQSTLLPQSWGGTNSCNTMESIDLQILRLHEMQAYVDAQAGGPGKGFFRLVSSPEQARQVIADGKMAIVLGIEASELFNCGLKDQTCSQAYVDAQLQKYHDLGVRVIYPIHRFDNQFGGARIEGGLINVGNNLSTGRYFSTSACAEETEGQMMINDLGLFGLEGLLGVSGSTNYDETTGQCNNRGLTDLGIYLVNRLMDMGMVIEVDHMSQHSHEAVLDIAEARQYSGLISGHSHMHAGTNGTVHPNAVRIAELGGILAPYNSDADTIGGAISGFLDKVEATDYLPGVTFSTDMSGIGNQPGPRASVAVSPLVYPFTTEFGFTVDKQITGNRSFDLNSDGMAHYGLVADHIQDIRERAPSRVYESVMNSAEAYLQMWERARGNTNRQFVNPLANYVTIYNRGTNTCMDIPGNDDGVTSGAWVDHYACQPLARDQRWLFDLAQGTISNQEGDDAFCLDNNGTPWNNGYPNLQACNGSSQQSWQYSGQRITNAGSNNHSLDAYGSGWVGFWQSHGNANQQWELRMDSASARWAEYRSAKSGLCLSASGVGAQLNLAACSGADAQLWQWQPTLGVLRSGLDPGLCVSSSARTTNNTPLVLAACSASAAQQFEQHADKSFRLKQNSQYAMDAAGQALVMWQHHGGSNQQWIATLPQ
ncbi:ricin-type beta-trefoil lectin domain protein [Marinobacter xiaoshiensis]|uniref:Ricin-type beta-trefoil lectin domain protein n=2 Tax=Marinobacter TaxID=2742 RepID=A0ABU2HC83_9GAMM|nr:ricin-type beta-trefoil lectin domain protein [Marinobacter sp. F60267]MDS1308689.1 ricin-type beta-trefoil lectin domain protein [Marinobacter sp. F60267]